MKKLGEKTFKRELAYVFVLHIFYMVAYDKIEALRILATPYLFYIFAVMGMTWTEKGRIIEKLNRTDGAPK